MDPEMWGSTVLNKNIFTPEFEREEQADGDIGLEEKQIEGSYFLPDSNSYRI